MKRCAVTAHDSDTEDKEMPSPSPRGFAMMRLAAPVSVSRAQLLLQYLLALEVGGTGFEPGPASVTRRQDSSGTGGPQSHPLPWRRQR